MDNTRQQAQVPFTKSPGDVCFFLKMNHLASTGTGAIARSAFGRSLKVGTEDFKSRKSQEEPPSG